MDIAVGIVMIPASIVTPGARAFDGLRLGSVVITEGTNLGASIAVRRRGEMLSESTPAMVGGRGFSTFARGVHPEPPDVEALK